MGRVEEAYLLVYTAPKNVKAIFYYVARVALSDFRHIFKMYLTPFKGLTVNFINTLLRKSCVVTSVDEQLSFMNDRCMSPSLARVPCSSRPLNPL